MKQEIDYNNTVFQNQLKLLRQIMIISQNPSVSFKDVSFGGKSNDYLILHYQTLPTVCNSSAKTFSTDSPFPAFISSMAGFRASIVSSFSEISSNL